MQVLLSIGIFLATLLGMEGFSWFVHRYLFHGPLWFIHKTHHEAHQGPFEFNDIFSGLFALSAIILIILGQLAGYDYRFWIGAGITAYGIIYFILHDVFVHNRIKSFQTHNRYLLRLRRAHKMHHKSMKKWPSESFGLLWVSKKYQP